MDTFVCWDTSGIHFVRWDTFWPALGYILAGLGYMLCCDTLWSRSGYINYFGIHFSHFLVYFFGPDK